RSLRLEQELREKKGYLPCYLDVKTIYESSQTKLASIDGIDKWLPKELLEKYLIERTFLQSTLTQILTEISNKFDSVYQSILDSLGLSKVEEVKERLSEIRSNIEDNKYLAHIEFPILKKIEYVDRQKTESSNEKKDALKGIGLKSTIGTEGVSFAMNTDSGLEVKKSTSIVNEKDVNFSSVFLQVFQIKEVIITIQEVLSALKIKHLYILLDDFSEIEDDSIKAFVDVILAP